nr:Chain C, HAUS augmin-like complex subunit 3 [Homo sapiens]6PTB_F Chain F, HAUS augmin-like complex subunit 3 [Homo sapiens]
ILNAMIAKI